MATITITNTRPARRNVAIASLLDKTRPARSKSSPAAMDRQPDLRTSTPRTTYLPEDCRNWYPTCGASALASDSSTVVPKPRYCYNWRPERGAAANGTHLYLQEDCYNWLAQRGAGQIEGHDKWPGQNGAGHIKGYNVYTYKYIYIYIYIYIYKHLYVLCHQNGGRVFVLALQEQSQKEIFCSCINVVLYSL